MLMGRSRVPQVDRRASWSGWKGAPFCLAVASSRKAEFQATRYEKTRSIPASVFPIPICSVAGNLEIHISICRMPHACMTFQASQFDTR